VYATSLQHFLLATCAISKNSCNIFDYVLVAKNTYATNILVLHAKHTRQSQFAIKNNVLNMSAQASNIT
jgi:hypothetical protein